jgi:outer membrane protein insertion porin family
MAKYCCLIIFFLLAVASRPVQAQPAVRVIILPFEIHAQENLSYLQAEIPEQIKKQLSQEGAKVLVLDPSSVPVTKLGIQSPDQIRELVAETGANFVIWGSLTWLGQNYSLDAKLLAISGTESPQVYTVEGQGIENLPGTVKKMAENLSLKLFQWETIVEVLITGNNRIEEDAIRRVLTIKVGDIYNAKNISDALKSLHAMGYFDDIRVEAQTVPDGKILTFRVTEKPTIRNILISGNSWVYDDDEIKEVLTIRKGSILNINTIQNDIRRIEELYKEKNYYNVTVTYNLYDKTENQSDLEYVIEEGKKFHIKKIEFIGNSTYSSRKLKGVMSTSEKNILSWITSAGDLNQDILNQDAAKLAAYYQNHGYINAKVGEPEVQFEEDGILVTIKIDEGPQFKVGTVTAGGDLIIPEEQLVGTVKIKKEEFYNQEVLRNDVIALTDIYSDEGYAYADISPRIDTDTNNLVVNINFDINKGQQVYFEEITISGNSKTRDKVIRRELQVYEQELYSGKRLKRSIRNLYRLDFFSDIKVNTIKGSADDKMKLKIDVTEKNTGALSFGVGYGGIENLFGTASISERNLFGRGQVLALRTQLGSQTTRFTLSFTEPWLFDIPLSSGFDIYYWNYSFPDYDKESVGGNLRTSYPLFDYTRGFLSYNYEIADIQNIEEDASSTIKRDAGKNVKSSIETRLRYDSRDNLFHPTEGSNHSGSLEYAGLGGNVGFIKAIGGTGWYFPLIWQTVGVLHGRAGYVTEAGGKNLPDYEKFYMYGIDALRGFDRDDLCPRDDEGNCVGGDKFVQLNTEVRFPLVKQAGVYGVVFFDTGDIYGEDESIDLTSLRESAGGGIRWLSPVGPIRLEYGFILDRQPTDHGMGGFEFSMASSF